MKKLITSCLVITAITGTSLENFGGGYALETFIALWNGMAIKSGTPHFGLRTS